MKLGALIRRKKDITSIEAHTWKNILLEVEVFVREMGFDDSCGLDSSSEHIVLGWYVVWLGNFVQTV